MTAAGLSRETLDAILARGDRESGAAKSQVDAFCAAIAKLEATHPAAGNRGFLVPR